MTITQTDYVERVLIVLNPDGSFRGAHAERLREVREDGMVISARQDVQPLGPDDLTAVLPNAAVLMTDLAASERTLAAVIAERDALQAKLDTLMRERTDRS